MMPAFDVSDIESGWSTLEGVLSPDTFGIPNDTTEDPKPEIYYKVRFKGSYQKTCARLGHLFLYQAANTD